MNYNANEMPDNLKMLAKVGTWCSNAQTNTLQMSTIQGQRTPFVYALLSTLREGILFDQDEVFKALGKRVDTKIHIIWVCLEYFIDHSSHKDFRALLTQLFLTL